MDTSNLSLDRRNFLKGASVVGGVMAMGALAGCSSSGGDAKQSSSSSGGTGEYAQAAPVSYAADFLVDPKAEWEVVAKVEGSKLIEGMNFKNNELWFIDVATSSIHKVVDGEVKTIYHDDAKKAMPNGAKFINDTTMLITDRAQGLCSFDINTLEYKVLQSEFEGVKFLGLNDLVLDGLGGAYFTDPGQSDCLTRNGSVYYVNYGDGSYTVEKWAEGVAYPNGITISPDSNFLYVAEFNTNSILVVPSKSYKDGKDTPYVLARLTGGHGPDGLLTDADGNIYAAHLHAGEVVATDPKGYQIAQIRLPKSAGLLVSNLIIHEGYLYVCEFSQGIIWRIKTAAKENTLA